MSEVQGFHDQVKRYTVQDVTLTNKNQHLFKFLLIVIVICYFMLLSV